MTIGAAKNPDNTAADKRNGHLVHGSSTSLNLLACEGQEQVLSVNQQRIAMTDNRFVLLACVVDGHRQKRVDFLKLGQKVADAIPDLWGIVGGDILDTENGLQVLVVNPRIPTSYVGLKDSNGINPAGLVLNTLTGGTAVASADISVIGGGCEFGVC
jgi:predicted ATP-grasp superfamily ATP-dependent carboligase